MYMYILQLNVREFLVSSDRFRCLAVSADAVTGSVSRHDTVIHLSGKDRPQAAGVCTPPPPHVTHAGTDHIII